MNIEYLPKGAIPDSPDERDYKIETLGALPPVDWSKRSGITPPLINDQGSSDSCVSQAFSYYHQVLKGKDFSRRDLFARIAQNYGAAIRDGGLAIVKQGQATRDEVSDPSPETPQNMRDKTGITLQVESSDQELSSFVLPPDIDSVASAILAYKGVVFGVTGSNPGWQDLTNPRPPQSGEATWGHALYAYDFHIHDGLKCIIALPSWSGVSEHHIKEDYFKSGNTFNPWTLIPKGQTMQLIRDTGTVYLVAG